MSTSLTYLTHPVNDFEDAYLAVRKKEGRLYNDTTVKQLPYLPKEHPQAQEWALRQQNVAKLIRHLRTQGPKQLLDLGCGNGWLTQRIAHAIPCQRILGMDINETELQQAHQLFGSSTCQFVYGDIFAEHLNIGTFDAIVLASCVQYFSDLPGLLQRILSFLQPHGEIHLLDTPLYPLTEINSARQRTNTYYQKQAVAAMKKHYHHHSWEELNGFEYKIKYQPSSFSNRIRRKLGGLVSPFPWLIIRHPS